MTYERVGFCFFCLEPIEAAQPGGRDPHHVADQVPYRQCAQALTDDSDPFVIVMPAEVAYAM